MREIMIDDAMDTIGRIERAWPDEYPGHDEPSVDEDETDGMLDEDEGRTDES